MLGGSDQDRCWTVPKMWPDNTCYILGGGPSLKLIDVNRLRHSRVIAINNAYELGNWIDVLFFGDQRWFAGYRDLLGGFGGLKVTRYEGHAREPGVLSVAYKSDRYGICTDPASVCWNLNSGACAINLAVHFGVKKIVLLGFDMRRVGTERNWHSKHANERSDGTYESYLTVFPDIRHDLDALGVECVNATPGSALTAFPIVDPDSALPRSEDIPC